MKKILAIVLAAVMLLSMTACGAAAKKDTYVVGICQLVQHDALDAATQGFQDALTEALGDKVEFEVQNASGDSANCTTIINGFVSSRRGSDHGQRHPRPAGCRIGDQRDPHSGHLRHRLRRALWSIDGWTGTVGGNISGTSDLAPLDQQAAMIQELFPDAKNVGLLYCSAEPNSQYQVDEMTKLPGPSWVYTCTALRLHRHQRRCLRRSGGLRLPATCSTSPPTTPLPPTPRPLPTWCCRPRFPSSPVRQGICEGCGVATLSISYYDLGVRPPARWRPRSSPARRTSPQMPMEYAPQVTKMYNAANCETLWASPFPTATSRSG